jgi:transposase
LLQEARYGVAGWPAAGEREQSRTRLEAYNVKELWNQEMRVAEPAQKSYEHFVEAWRPRRSKEKARGCLNPARLE